MGVGRGKLMWPFHCKLIIRVRVTSDKWFGCNLWIKMSLKCLKQKTSLIQIAVTHLAVILKRVFWNAATYRLPAQLETYFGDIWYCLYVLIGSSLWILFEQGPYNEICYCVTDFKWACWRNDLWGLDMVFDKNWLTQVLGHLMQSHLFIFLPPSGRGVEIAFTVSPTGVWSNI